jgi:endonuclease/exonuclease/phosphatase family metal-dependent hydrolase
MSRKRRFTLGCLTIIVLLIGYRIAFIYRWRAGDCSTGPQPTVTSHVYPKRLLVMTYNIEGDAELLKGWKHIDDVAAVINQVKPDIVGINEIHRHTWQSRFHDQVDRLQRLTHLNGVFGRSYSELGGAFGNAMLTRGAIVSADVHNLPCAGEPRSLLATTIRIDHATIQVYVAHVAAWGGLNSSIRAKQLDCLGSHVRVSKYPHIVTGDFNAPPQASEIAAFRRVNTTLQICGADLPITQRLMRRRIDYIFADLGWHVREAHVVETGPSDHFPVVAELTHEETQR